MYTESIDLDLIDPNPYQPREREDPEHIARMARSIAEIGLLQTPLGREMAGRYQLAFGHTRLAAFRKLAADGQPEYHAMPLQIAPLDDLMMFELAIRENSERQDLTPIEEARAMAVYRDQFQKSSEEIGQLFGLAASTVRNKLRLLDLPAAVQAQVEAGALSEGTARTLLTVQRIAPEQVAEIGTSLAEGAYENPEAVTGEIKRQLRNRPNVLQMWVKEADGRKLAGTGLWPLDWDVPEFLDLTPGQFTKIFPEHEAMAEYVPTISAYLHHEPDVAPQSIQIARPSGHYRPGNGILVPDVERIDLPLEAVTAVCHLIRPPVCSQCPYYARLDGAYWCGLQPCFARKKRAWLAHELERVSEALGIPIYDRATDGPYYDEGSYWGDNPTWEGWFAERAEHLRLKAKFSEYNAHKLTESHVAVLISVRDDYQERVAAEKEREAARKAEQADTHQAWQREHRNRALADAFIWQVASSWFASALTGLRKAVHLDLANVFSGWDEADLPARGAARQEYLLRVIANGILQAGIPWHEKALGAGHIAGHLAGVALTWGVTLPENWHELAETFGVSMETEASDDN